MYKKDIFFTIAAVVVTGLLVIAWKGGVVFHEPVVMEEKLTVLPVLEAPPVEYRDILQSQRIKTDQIMECYRNEASKGLVIAFFSELTGSEEVAQAVLVQAEAFNISPSLAFSLAWEESKYNALAESKENGNESMDRGLFQLNNYSFPDLSEADFFDPKTNAHHGMSHLRWCLDVGGSEVSALAMYNAGLRRVTTGGTPKRTLDYISRVLHLKDNIEALFESECPRITPSIAEEEKQPQNNGLREFFRAIL
ncbi:hypothetical protein FACS1894161_2890 [Spirochaetia bacterium]|nr:hypothetical protein FACS1894161_2890 [Spirochaetia bacterium]